MHTALIILVQGLLMLASHMDMRRPMVILFPDWRRDDLARMRREVRYAHFPWLVRVEALVPAVSRSPLTWAELITRLVLAVLCYAGAMGLAWFW